MAGDGGGEEILSGSDYIEDEGEVELLFRDGWGFTCGRVCVALLWSVC